MNKLSAQLKMQLKINKMFVWYFMIFVVVVLGMCIYIAGSGLVAMYSKTVPIAETSIFSFAAIFSMFYFFYLPVSAVQGFSQSLQYAVRMSSTRKDFFTGSIVFYFLSSFIWAAVIVLFISLEYFARKLGGRTLYIELFNIISFKTFNLPAASSIFLFYFSALLSLTGLVYFINGLLASIFKGKTFIILIAALFLLVYLFTLFTPFKLLVANFVLSNMGILLYLKLIIIGLSGFILSWSFIERLEIINLNFR